MDRTRAVWEQIGRQELGDLTGALVRTESHRGVPGGETTLARQIGAFLASEGISTEITEVLGARCNVTAVLPGRDGGENLLLLGHTDTVAAGEMDHPPFRGDCRDGKVWGRGAADMKGGNAAMLLAMAAIVRAGVPLSGDLCYAGVVAEESPDNSEGTQALLAGPRRYHGAIVGEPTGLMLAGWHKGMSWLRVEVRGRASHASCPENGANAVSAAARMIAALEEEVGATLGGRTHPHLSPATLSIGRVCGGTQENIVPEACWFSLDRRTIPGEDAGSVREEIRQCLQKVASRHPGISFSLTEMPETVGRGPLSSGLSHPLAEAVRAGMEQAGAAPRTGGVEFWTDAARLEARGIPAVVFGPGHIQQAHAPTEFVDVEELLVAARVYAAAALRLLGSPDGGAGETEHKSGHQRR